MFLLTTVIYARVTSVPRFDFAFGVLCRACSVQYTCFMAHFFGHFIYENTNDMYNYGQCVRYIVGGQLTINKLPRSSTPPIHLTNI